MSGLSVNLNSESVVNERTGAVEAPSEYVENLRMLEREIQHFDDTIGALKADLKTAKDGREKCVASLRSAIREGKVLPLLETADIDGDDTETDEPTQ